MCSNIVQPVLKMNIPISYLFTIANLPQLIKVAGPLKETSIHLGTLSELTDKLVNTYHDHPLEGFMKNGLQKQGNVTIYISKALQAYIFEDRGNSNDEGVIVKLEYGGDGDVSNVPNTLSYFIHGKEVTDDVKKKIIKDLIEISKNGVKGRDEGAGSSLLDALKSNNNKAN